MATRWAFFKTAPASLGRAAGGYALALAALLLLAPGARAQAPDEAWRTITTEHFRVTFPKGMEALGRRAGARAEQAWTELDHGFVKAPSGKIDLLLTDHTDITNGYADVTPSDRVVVFARPPVDDPNLGYFDDWMELVITHELTHVFHLDETGHLGRPLRAIFGRVPVTWPFFPDLGLPRWTTEGVATWYESEFTHSGRTVGTYHEMQMRTAVLEHDFEHLDQASGDSPVWPAGNRAYAYGSRFFRYLLDKHGDAKMGAFARAVANQWVPYRLDAAGKKAFGETISQEWREWTDSLEREYAHLDEKLSALGPLTQLQRLSNGARYGQNIRISPDGKRLTYVWADGRSDTQIRVAAPDGSGARELTRTNGLPTFDFMPDGSILVSQLELKDPYRTYADLYIASPDGHQRRLTVNARLDYPAVAPDGTWAAAVQEGGGTTNLVRVDLQTGAVRPITPPEPDVLWTMPRVSPDGRWIAATRWTPGAFTDVVVVDTAGKVRVTLTHDRAIDLAPAWTPDGRTVLWGSDRSGISNILAADVDPAAGTAGPLRLVTNVETGVGYPTVDPSGQWLYVSVYHANGWDVARTRLDRSGWRDAPPVAARFDAPPRSQAVQDAEVTGPEHDYSAGPTLRPHYWEPVYWEAQRSSAVRTSSLYLRSRQVLGPSFGIKTSGSDLVGRHSFDAQGRFYTGSSHVDGTASYSYAGLGDPLLSLGVSQQWLQNGVRLGRQQTNDFPPYDTLFSLVRERSVGASVTFRHSRWRQAFQVALGGSMVWDHENLLGNDMKPQDAYRPTLPDTRLADGRVTFQYTTARTHSFQIGPAQGFSMLLRGRVRKDLSVPDTLARHPGWDHSVDEVLGEMRAYRELWGPGYAGHVLAVRGAFGYARGAGASAGWFGIGGASGEAQTLSGLSLFGGRPLFFPVRGYPEGARGGRLAWTTSAEYRFPLLLVNRGLGSWPASLDRTMGVLFFDAGNAWGPELTGVSGYDNPRRSTLMSVGGELDAETLTFWTAHWTVRVGVAVPLVDASGANVYLRLGLPV